MPTAEIQAESRFNRLVLGSWWVAVTALGLLRLWEGDATQAILLLVSATLTALLGVGLSIDRERSPSLEANAQALRLQKAAMLFSVIAISTVVACAAINHVMWWAAFECAALIWIFPAVILPLVQAFVRRRGEAHAG